jgi:Tfp pilus assembly protein PilN
MTPQINLLPEVRQLKLKAKRQRRIVTAVSAITVGTSVLVVIVLVLVSQGQKVRIRQLTNDIQSSQSEISGTPDLAKMLTTQQNLKSLPGLYQQRILMTRFYDLLSRVSPRDMALESLAIDGQNVLKVEGRARNYALASKFAKALEASNLTFGEGADEENAPHFSEVSLGTVAADDSGRVVFTLSAKLATEVVSVNR